MKRLYFLDNLKAFIILLVIVFHVAMGYTTWNLKWWYVNDIQQSHFFDLFILTTDVYIMPIMFLIAGYFAPGVLVKKGGNLFGQDKLKRIVIPWLGGVIFLAPLIAYSAIFSRTATPPNYFSFWANDFFTKYYQQAHYWFLGILVLFFAFLIIAYKINPHYFEKQPQPGIPSAKFFVLFAVISALPFFIANLFYPADTWMPLKLIFMIQPVRIGLYACYFALGIYAWKNSWFTVDGYFPRLVPWVTCAVVMMVAFAIYRIVFTLTPNIPILYKAGHALTFSLFCMAAAFALIAIFQRFFDSDAILWRKLAANSYIIYFIHQLVVIPLAYAVQQLQLNIWIKYLGVSLASVMICFLIAEYIITPVLGLGNKHARKPSA